ncbi:hypothetical protein ABB30_08320 [Stenotrophomonas ginsengisoli]|uniref:HTH cro/C1-type domain-containing protein n=1 Tax=Stenotrophomonas ginsengisoli TaxID=336566 RepID=A0A0R0DGM0_9GAMM|nr:transcriptional regulator [Stenotrophomonas ginsengisoli]KRG76964.1 hypothetical protein ABB30_08320 [Stenotrophomonas ginsengisoli]
MNPSIKSPDELLADLGSRVKARRGAMTQMDLADKARVSRRALVDLEAGKGSSLVTYVRVMKALGLEQQLLDAVPRPTVSPMAMLGKSASR